MILWLKYRILAFRIQSIGKKGFSISGNPGKSVVASKSLYALVIFLFFSCSGTREVGKSRLVDEEKTQVESPEEVEESVGIHFFEGSWGDALNLARAENKYIFMDCYASWCRPCKMMDEREFVKHEVGEVFNEHFINVKMNMEQGEGITLGQKYHVSGYPTLLIIDQKGNIIDRAIGYHSASQLINFARKNVKQD